MRLENGVTPSIDVQDLPTSGVERPQAKAASVLEAYVGHPVPTAEEEEAKRRRSLGLNPRDSPIGGMLNCIYPL